MSDLVERFRVLDGKVRDGERSSLPPTNMDEILAGAFAVGEENRALKAEIERLTAELAAARAKLEQYEQAPVVGWSASDGSIFTTDEATASVWKRSFDLSPIALIARPEAKP